MQDNGWVRQRLGPVLCGMLAVLGEGSTGVGQWPRGTGAVQGAARAGQWLTRDPVCLKTLRWLWL